MREMLVESFLVFVLQSLANFATHDAETIFLLLLVVFGYVQMLDYTVPGGAHDDDDDDVQEEERLFQHLWKKGKSF